MSSCREWSRSLRAASLGSSFLDLDHALQLLTKKKKELSQRVLHSLRGRRAAVVRGPDLGGKKNELFSKVAVVCGPG